MSEWARSEPHAGRLEPQGSLSRLRTRSPSRWPCNRQLGPEPLGHEVCSGHRQGGRLEISSAAEALREIVVKNGRAPKQNEVRALFKSKTHVLTAVNLPRHAHGHVPPEEAP